MLSARKKRGLVALCILVDCLLIGGAVYLFWSPPPVTETKVVRLNMTLSQAQAVLTIPLPAGATNISYASWSMGAGFEEYLRFEAPPQTCLAHAPVVLARAPATGTAPASGPAPSLAPIATPPSPVHSSNLDVSWFDVQNIREGVTSGGGGSHVPVVWVDANRGVFYYRMTD